MRELDSLRNKALAAIIVLLVVPSIQGAFIFAAIIGQLLGATSDSSIFISGSAGIAIWIILVHQAIKYFHEELDRAIARIKNDRASQTGPEASNHSDGDPPVTGQEE